MRIERQLCLPVGLSSGLWKLLLVDLIGWGIRTTEFEFHINISYSWAPPPPLNAPVDVALEFILVYLNIVGNIFEKRSPFGFQCLLFPMRDLMSLTLLVNCPSREWPSSEWGS